MQNKNILYVVLLMLPLYAQAIVIGSNTVVSVQPNAVFPSTDSDNTMLGFAAFNNGFSLGNSTASVIYNDFFPVSGNIDLRNGIMNLSQDFAAASMGVFISTGTVNGSNFNFSLPSINGTLSFPSTSNPLIAVATQVGNTTGNLSVDWSVTNTVLAVSGTNVAATSNMRLLGFNGSTITTDNSTLVASNPINSVRWHPSAFYFAFAKTTGGGAVPNEVSVYRDNNNVLTLTGSEDLGGTSANAVAWHPGGLFLTAGTSAAATGARLYSFNVTTGVIALLSTAATSGVVQRSAMDWETNGNFLVVGTATANQLQIFSFNGIATLTITLSTNVGNPVTAVSASSVGGFIAVGISGGIDNLRVFQHDTGAGTLTDLAPSHVGETANVLSVQWSPDGTKLAVGLAVGATTQFRVYSFNTSTFVLTLLAVANYSNNVNAVRWSRDGTYLVTADGTTTAGVVNLVIYQFATTVSQTPFMIRNAKTILNSDVTVNAPLFFQGYCQIEGNGHRLDLTNASLSLLSSSTLLMHNVIVKGIAGSNINIANSSGLIQLQDSTWILSSNYTFSFGALEINGNCVFTGTSSFIYTSPTSSTIKSNSRLLFDNGMTFSYAPSSSANNLLAMVDQTSVLYFLNTSLALTTVGLKLTKGSFIIDGLCAITSDATALNQGLSIGDGISSANNLTLQILAESGFNLIRGFLVDNNV